MPLGGRLDKRQLLLNHQFTCANLVANRFVINTMFVQVQGIFVLYLLYLPLCRSYCWEPGFQYNLSNCALLYLITFANLVINEVL